MLWLFFSWVCYRWKRSCRRRRTSLRLCVSTVFEVAVLQLSLLQVKEILQEEEDLSEIVCLNCFWGCCSSAEFVTVTGEGDPAGGGGPLWDCVFQLFLRLLTCCSSAEFLTGEGDPAGGGGPLRLCSCCCCCAFVFQLVWRLLFFSWVSYRWRRSCRRRRISLRLCFQLFLRLLFFN